MTARLNLAIVGAPGVVSEAVLAILEEREHPFGEVFVLGAEADVGERMRCCGKSLKVESVAQFDFSRAAIAIFCGDEALAQANAAVAAESGCTVIDCSPAFHDDPAVPLVLPGVNPEALEGFRERNMVAIPSATTAMLLTVLKPLHDAAGVVRADITSLESVSQRGKPGVDELSSQVVALLNMRDAPNDVFSQRIAFNLIPKVGELLDDGYTDAEAKVPTETQKILPQDAITLNLTAVQVPLFYGHGMALHLQTASTLLAEEAIAILESTPGVVVERQAEPPTPALQAANSDKVHVGRVRQSATAEAGLNLWITADNSRKGAALSAVQIAELMQKCYM
ncbi:MAG: aspartate-semialdehyde dehydrogenase [Pseudomonadota bacterium]